jgi:hypothetical protein
MSEVKLFPALTHHARNSWKQAKARDKTIEEEFGRKACGKDTRAFWFLAGYWAGQASLQKKGSKQ